MNAARKTRALVSVLLPASGQLQPPDPAVVQRILAAHTQSGLFKLAGGALAIAVPAATLLPIMVVDAGVDKVRADPERFAGDVSTVEGVVKNLPRKANLRMKDAQLQPKNHQESCDWFGPSTASLLQILRRMNRASGQAAMAVMYADVKL